MPIKKRLTEQQRLRKQLPKGWRRAVEHPLIKKLPIKPTPQYIAKAIKTTKSWKGASWDQKIFTVCLDLVLDKAFDQPLLELEAFNRLQEHIENNQSKIYRDDWRAWHVWIWDVYHDGMGLFDMEAGTLRLPEIAPKKRIKKPRRKKLPKK